MEKFWRNCLFLVLLTLMVSYGYSNQFYVSNPSFLHMQFYYEEDHLKEDNSLAVSAALTFVLDENFDSRDINFTIAPSEFLPHPEAKDVQVLICKDGKPHHTLDEMKNCENQIEYDISERTRYKAPYRVDKEFVGTISGKKLTKNQYYTIYIKYIIPNFPLKKGSSYLVKFDPGCNIVGCPKGSNFSRWVFLPKATSIPEYFNTQPARTEMYAENKLALVFYGKTPVVIRFFDANEREVGTPFLVGFTSGLFAGAILTLIGFVIGHREIKRRQS